MSRPKDRKPEETAAYAMQPHLQNLNRATTPENEKRFRKCVWGL